METISIENLLEKYRTPQGIYILEGVVANAGVLPYVVEENGQNVPVSILTDPTDLFDSLNNLVGVPVVKEHPEDFNAEINDMGGLVLEAYPISDFTAGVKVALWGDGVIDYVKEGNYELSAGYTAEVVKADGNWFGSPYSYQKKNINFNHLAVVGKGTARNGVSNKLLIDSNKINGCVSFLADSATHSIIKDVQLTDNHMRELTFIDSKGHSKVSNIDEDLYTYVQSLLTEKNIYQTQLTDSTKQIADLQNVQSTLEETTQQLNDAKASASTLERKLDEAKKSLPKHLKVATKAEKFGIEVDYDNFDPHATMKSALGDRYPNIDAVSTETLEYLFEITQPESTKDEEISTESEPTAVTDSKSGKSLKDAVSGVKNRTSKACTSEELEQSVSAARKQARPIQSYSTIVK